MGHRRLHRRPRARSRDGIAGMNTPWSDFWKADWEQARARHVAWWRREGLVLNVTALRDGASDIVPDPHTSTYYLMSGLDTRAPNDHPQALADAWLDPARRARQAERYLGAIYFGGEAFPYFDTHIGPGSLAMFLGAEPNFDTETVWYRSCITDLERHPPLRFDPSNPWFLKQQAIVEAGMALSRGRFLVGMPDLVENIDVLASLRDSQTLMVDMVERPTLVRERVAQINQAYFAAFARLFDIIKDPWGGNAFSAFAIWGPGKTGKVQCDAAAMISPAMFDDFVVPALSEQCAWLDYSMFHLDGTQAMPHLESLLAIEALDAIEWTPQAGQPQGGDPKWYGLYRRILDAGKSVQAVSVRPDEVIPLLDAVGARGMYVTVSAESEAEARALVEAVDAYR